MLSVDDALEECRAFAALAGEPLRSFSHFDRDEIARLSECVERLLVEFQLARWEAEQYREELVRWGIPAKRAMVKRLEKGGFDIGWE